jgi:toxin ParE1/3/4
MRVIWTAGARRDLDGIWTYIAADNPVAADHVDDDLVKAGESLAEMPRRGRPGRLADTRELIVPGRPYIVVYTLRGDTVAILRILHMAQSWLKLRRA